ncbi:pyridoxal phosphate-dependent aminotransferase [Paenibacillus macquariensis]|uniref:Aspartate aminotransferase/aminotransferase n=1 Tax=Paenibacillus macquariensis TaxID=948756 RepID=A0ABY1K2I1_9BACL|nr:aminotransferase class I/II-fold pyridoxal phosphate-dependent enzyme [Paenibacillus macquariensis]MEC0090199.1 aminotransferase class I/II-fold pyridoxal phosphate-dependent enzyme [Paenibacillus macquariensis]OAB39572.1 aspartate aminotransferase [Paenibacillus macquariensis subsp. macquariensis]SIR17235.1 aspartate aminotransferase/aminotransferase [Paenibacillus macquariensis]
MELRSEIEFFKNRFLMFVLDQMAYEYEKNGSGDVIRMTLGKSELPLHDEITGAMKDALDSFEKSTLVFPQGLPELREALAAEYKKTYDLDINSNNIVINVGTSSLFRNLFYLLAKEGDEILLPHPYYSLYHFCAQLVGAKVRYYNINTDTLALDMNSFKENFTDRTKIVVINSPGNPLGNILTKEDLYGIDEIINGRAVVINDEIYANVCFDERSTSVLELKNTKSTFITTNAFSKGYRMYSRRVGYCIAPDELVTPLTVMQHHTLLTTDPVVQFGAIEALQHEEEVNILVELYRGRRNYTVESFEKVPLVRAIPAEGSFYLTLDCSKYMEEHNISTSLELAECIMRSKQVATVPGSDFGLPTMLRLSYSNKRYNEGIDRLVDFFTVESAVSTSSKFVTVRK